ncbi:MAG: DUF4149 domain-containing protein [Pyrinomonadaceae bacterium]
MRLLLNFRILLIGLWLGAACFFSFAVAPSAFAVLPSRELAGSVVSRTLAIVNYSGLIISLILLASSFVKQSETNRFRLLAERFLLVIFGLACGVGQFVIALWFAHIRSQMNRPIDELAVEDPLRLQFNNLHEYSVWILVTAMVAALVLFFLLSQKPERKIIPDKINV